MFSSIGSWISTRIFPSNAANGKKLTKAGEVAEKELNAKMSNSSSTTPIKPDTVRKCIDGTAVVPYDLFYQSLSKAMPKEVLKSITSPLLTLIIEYMEDEVTAIPSSSCCLGRQFVSSIGFGKKMWSYFGDIGEAPPIPKEICSILAMPDPFDGKKTVLQTHILALIPATLNETPMTLKRLGELMVNIGHTGFDFSYSFFFQNAGMEFEASHWVLMRKTVPDTTRNENYEVQQKFVKDNHPTYQIPKVEQAVSAMFLEKVATDTYHFSLASTRCQGTDSEGWIAGFYYTTGLKVHRCNNNDKAVDCIGVAPLRVLS